LVLFDLYIAFNLNFSQGERNGQRSFLVFRLSLFRQSSRVGGVEVLVFLFLVVLEAEGGAELVFLSLLVIPEGAELVSWCSALHPLGLVVLGGLGRLVVQRQCSAATISHVVQCRR